MRAPERLVRPLLITLALAHAGAASAAAPDPHTEAARALIRTLELREGLEPMTADLRDAVVAQLSGGVDPERSAIAAPYLQEIASVVEQALAWDEVESDFVDLYTATFTEAELVELQRTLTLPVMVKYRRSIGRLNGSAMAILREETNSVAPQLAELVQEMQAALAANEPPGASP